jgi:hypothetical protein
MPRAIFKNGMIYPLEPLPPEWSDGRELLVEDAQEPDESPEAIDKWYQELQAMEPPLKDPKEIEQFQTFLSEIRQRDREIVLTLQV